MTLNIATAARLLALMDDRERVAERRSRIEQERRALEAALHNERVRRWLHEDPATRGEAP